MPKKLNLTNKKFGRLLAIEYSHTDNKGYRKSY